MDMGTFEYEQAIMEIKKLLKEKVGMAIVPVYDCTPGSNVGFMGYRIGKMETGDN